MALTFAAEAVLLLICRGRLAMHRPVAMTTPFLRRGGEFVAQTPAVRATHIPGEKTAAPGRGLSAQRSAAPAAVANLLGHTESCQG